MIVARSALLAVLLCVLAAALPLAGVASAQDPAPTPSTSGTVAAPATIPTSKDAPEPQAVEPQVGTAAPAQPGATTPTVEPVPVPTVTVTAGGTPATAGGAPATAGGVVVTKSEQDSGGVSWEAIALIVLGSLLLFILIVLILWRVRGWDPRWLQRWRHAMGEAGWRLSLGWAEFRDFVRLGR